jgi:hypothetical protein
MAEAVVAFDTGSAFTVVSSDMCFSCESQAYVPGHSETVIDHENSWQLSYPHDNTMKLSVHEYTDSVCLESGSLCVEDFTIYVIFS